MYGSVGVRGRFAFNVKRETLNLEPEALSGSKKPVPSRATGGYGMETKKITIEVDAESAEAYQTASEEERRKIDALLSLQLDELTRPDASLKEVMREMSREAQERGLTPDILKDILDE